MLNFPIISKSPVAAVSLGPSAAPADEVAGPSRDSLLRVAGCVATRVAGRLHRQNDQLRTNAAPDSLVVQRCKDGGTSKAACYPHLPPISFS